MDNLGEQDFYVLLKGYLEESLSPADLEIFLSEAARPENILLLQQSFKKDLENDPPDLSSPGQAAQAWSSLRAKLETDRRTIRPRRFSVIWVAASVGLLCILGAAYFFRNHKHSDGLARLQKEMILPAWLKTDHVGATLYLMNGDSVMLDDQSKGVISTQGDSQISQSDGSISYSGSGMKNQFNKIKTGRGKLFRCILPDQTIAWLNAGSSIKYPLQFTADQRSVEITGEVYFEVAHHPGLPFRVKAGGQLLEDIGTIFNIEASTSDIIVTTLVEGAVSIQFNNKKASLNPGEQSIASTGKNEFSVQQHANLEKALAWKNGLFYFQNADLHTVMNQLSNWYNADVIYQGSETKELFSGQIDKSLALEQILLGLQQPGITFTVNNNHQIIVSRK